MTEDSGRTWLSRRMAAVLLLGFSSGLPLAFTTDTLALRLTDDGLRLAEIGAFAAVGLPYVLKFLWAPLLDRFAPPLLDRRRGWILVSQAILVAATLWLATADAAVSVAEVAAAAFAVAFAGATQDIVIDAWRTESFAGESAAPAVSVHVTGYRLGMLASGAGALFLRGPLGFTWSETYVACAALLALGALGAFLAPPVPRDSALPRREAPREDEMLGSSVRAGRELGGASTWSSGSVRPPAGRSAAPASLRETVVLPFRDLLVRPRAASVLLFVLLFKLPDYLAGAMTMPFLRQIGIPLEQIGSVRQGLGVFVTIAGTLAGGYVASRVGLRRALFLYGILQAVSNLAFSGLAIYGARLGVLTGAVVVENFCAGLVTAGFLGFVQRQCSPAVAATQFALLTSLMALPPRVLGPLAGGMAESLGWPAFFAVSTLFGLPGLALIPWATGAREPPSTGTDASGEAGAAALPANLGA